MLASSVMHARSSARLHDFMSTPSSSFATAPWQREGERRAHSYLALHPDPAPVQLDALPATCQPHPRALHLLFRCPHLPELLEHSLLILRGDADAGVAD